MTGRVSGPRRQCVVVDRDAYQLVDLDERITQIWQAGRRVDPDVRDID